MAEMKDYFEFSPENSELEKLSSLALAHVGDAVFELLVRTWMIERGNATAGKLHADTVKIVNARAQAEYSRLLAPLMDEEETAVFKRGRNSRVNSVPKNMSVADYHAATGLEALFGWLWLNGRRDRINLLFDAVVKSI